MNQHSLYNRKSKYVIIIQRKKPSLQLLQDLKYLSALFTMEAKTDTFVPSSTNWRGSPPVCSLLSVPRTGPEVWRSHTAPSNGETRPCQEPEGPRRDMWHLAGMVTSSSDLTVPNTGAFSPNFSEIKETGTQESPLRQLTLPGSPIKWATQWVGEDLKTLGQAAELSRGVTPTRGWHRGWKPGF